MWLLIEVAGVNLKCTGLYLCLDSAKCCKTYWKLPHNANEEWASVYFKSNPGKRGTWHLLLPMGSRLQAVIHCYLDTMMYKSHPSFLIFCFWFSSAKYFVPQGEISLTTGTTRATYMGTHTQWDKDFIRKKIVRININKNNKMAIKITTTAAICC